MQGPVRAGRKEGQLLGTVGMRGQGRAGGRATSGTVPNSNSED